jgi:hypothetical protein
MIYVPLSSICRFHCVFILNLLLLVITPHMHFLSLNVKGRGVRLDHAVLVTVTHTA